MTPQDAASTADLLLQILFRVNQGTFSQHLSVFQQEGHAATGPLPPRLPSAVEIV